MLARWLPRSHRKTSSPQLWGTTTAGRLLSGSVFKAGHGYFLGLPVAAYLTWQGVLLEGRGVSPDIGVDLPRDALQQGRDTQLEAAIRRVTSS